MEPAPQPHPVTIVVPIYGDLPSLISCIESLRRNVDQSVHRVLLMNDNGPSADEIEDTVLPMIADDPAFSYERNARNLGFVGNCNRAVLEVDDTSNDILLLNSDTVTTPGFIEELSAVLHASPRHGAVCPRSNNATIASLPYRQRDASVGRHWQRTAEVHGALADALPRWSISPVAMGFCILMRREVIAAFGLFDEAFSPGYGEENDFCLRIAEHGYVSVIAHRALVFHVGARSFAGPRRTALRAAHERILVRRYPHYPEAVHAYLHRDRDAVDVFADALMPGDDVSRVLIDIDESSRGRLRPEDRDILKAARRATNPAVQFTVAVPDPTFARVSRQFPQLSVVRQSRLDGLWDLALATSANLTRARSARLNRTSLRWGVALHPGAEHTKGFENAVAPIESMRTTDGLLEIVARHHRSVVDLAHLRARWDAITHQPGHLDDARLRRESLLVRLSRRARLIVRRPLGRIRRALRG